MRKYWKKIAMEFLALAVAFTSMPMNVYAAEADSAVEKVKTVSANDVLVEETLPVYQGVGESEHSGVFGDNNGFSWSYDEEARTITVTGEDSGLGGLGNELRNNLPSDGLHLVDTVIFQDCVVSGSLRSLLSSTGVGRVEFHNVDASNVTDMSRMFYMCEGLYSVDLSGLVASNVTDMNGMFYGCGALIDIDLSNLDTRNVTNMSYMFYGCDSLESVNLSSLDVSNVLYSYYMRDIFTGCPNLKTVKTPKAMAAGVSVKLPHTFCDLQQNRIDEFTSEHCNMTLVRDKRSIFGDNNGFISVYDEESGTLTVTGEDSGLNKLQAVYTSAMWSKINKIIFQDCIVSGSMAELLYNLKYLKEVEFNNINTENVTDMSYMFYGCSNLTSLDMSGFDTRNVGSMIGMFRFCSNLTSVDVSSFDTSNVMDMSYMFSGCSNLTNLDVSGFDTGNVMDMTYMFVCLSLTSLDVSSFDTSSVIRMKGMFLGCVNLTSVDVSGFDTGNVTDMGQMFEGCSNLTSVDVSSFDTRNVGSMIGMFRFCSNLTSVDVSSFDTSNVESIMDMFVGCVSLTSVDVSNFDMRNLKTSFLGIGSPFYNCNNLQTIKTPKYMAEGVNIELPYAFCNAQGKRFELLTMESCNMDLEKDTRPIFGDNLGFGWTYNESTCTLTVTGEDSGLNNMQKYIPDTVLDSQFDHMMNVIFKDCKVSGSLSGLMKRRGFRSPQFINFDTRNVTDMSSMFLGCRNLTSVDMSGFDTGNVTDMSFMFSGCLNLISVDMSGFDTGNVTDMSFMFSGCSSLVSVDMSGFDTRNVTSMENIFGDDMVSWERLNIVKTPKAMAEGQVITLPYIFYDSEGNGFTEITSDSCNKTLMHIWEYPITYYLNGGENSKANPETYPSNAEITLKEPTKKGYVFLGWYSDNTYENKVTKIEKGSRGAIQLYAKWTPICYTIKFVGRSTSGEMDDLKNRMYDTSYKLPANAFKHTGYTFTGWNTFPDGSGQHYDNKATVKNLAVMDGATVTLYAQWAAHVYTIKFDKNGATGGTMRDLTNRSYGTSYKLPANKFKRTGYTFTSWNTKKNGSGKTYKNQETVANLVSGNGQTITLYAQWTPNKYTIKFNKNGATSGTMKDLINRKYGTSYKLTANAFKRTGYTFTGWNTKKNGKGKTYKDKASVKNLTSANNKTITLYAQWKKESYKITYKLNGGKNNSSNPKKYDVTTKTITLKAPTRKGYTFKGWYSDSKCKKKVSKIAKGSTGNVTLYAKWAKK